MRIPGYKYVSSDDDRHGNRRWYFRRPGKQKIRIYGEPDSAEFKAAYQSALAGIAIPPGKRIKTAPPRGTLGWLLIEYLKSTAFTNDLSPSTQATRRRIIDKVRETAGHELVRDINQAAIRKGMERRAHAPDAANDFKKAMSAAFKWAIVNRHATSNPTVGVERLRTKNPAGVHTWTPDEVRQYEAKHPIGTRARLAMAFMRYTGVRRSDAIRLGPQHVRDGCLAFNVKKNEANRAVPIEIPILPELQEIIDATPDKGETAFLVTDAAQPWGSGQSFGNRFRDWCAEAGLAHCSPHGLRKAGATMAAENGASESELKAIFGWTDTKMAAHYTRSASRRRLAKAGMHRLVERKKPAKLPHRLEGAKSEETIV